MRWIIGRLLLSFITIIGSLTLIFVLIRLMPGNPIDYLISQLMYTQQMPIDAVMAYVKSYYGFLPNKPIHEQYIEYMCNMLRGDFGKSLLYLGTPVNSIIGHNLPWTLFLLSYSILVSFILGITIGIFLAYKRGTKLDSAFTLGLTILNSVPPYIVALILVTVGIFTAIPYRGAYSVEPSFSPEFIANVFYHATLPMISYTLVTFSGWALAMRGSAITILGSDYIVVAIARGLSKRRILTHYVGKTAILPVFTSLVISLGFMFGGAVFIETIFAYPGVGYFLSMAVAARDYPLIQGCFFVIVVSVVLGTLLADIIYYRIDPRVRRGEV
ncbi:MAG: ABC transporter permease [Thermoprotei archaeon]|nr:MAG: ABC transporter permease [Thermoprotei archaeon]RLF05395.1 MAG: ABC transporter permease [Thermoprotei archaeon]